MGKKHEKKYLIYVLIGLILVTSAIFTIIYLIFTSTRKFDWTFWAIVTAVVTNVGLLFLGSAFVHKMKSDLLRKQKRKTNAENATGME
jgi:hypothetical protein